MSFEPGLILLDRDGVLNAVVVDAEHGTIDSPQNPEQVQIIAGVPEALLVLNNLGFRLVIVTNQPSFAKKKTTRENLLDVHTKILELIQNKRARILASYICFHQAQDDCHCRKPRTGLLEKAFLDHSQSGYFGHSESWMVGDGVTDIQAGAAVSLKTAFLGPQKCDACKVFDDLNLKPNFWGKSLLEFARFLERSHAIPHNDF